MIVIPRMTPSPNIDGLDGFGIDVAGNDVGAQKRTADSPAGMGEQFAGFQADGAVAHAKAQFAGSDAPWKAQFAGFKNCDRAVLLFVQRSSPRNGQSKGQNTGAGKGQGERTERSNSESKGQSTGAGNGQGERNERSNSGSSGQSTGEILLIRKKRGLGAGKINGPGGKLEEGESFADAALRECAEEVGLRAFAPELRGRLYFAFADGYNIYVEVFWSHRFEGSIRETDEAVPFWCPVQKIPYSEMWSDDRIWLPLALQGQNFVGYIAMDGDRILSLSFRSAGF